jgi:hypothetical protein
MKDPRKKVPYTKPSKRNPLKDIPSDAARRAKHREAEKEAETELRKALGNPTDANGQRLAGRNNCGESTRIRPWPKCSVRLRSGCRYVFEQTELRTTCQCQRTAFVDDFS